MAQEPQAANPQAGQDSSSSTDKIRSLLDDPEFYALHSPKDRQRALATYDPEFNQIPPEQINSVIERIYPEAYAKHARAPKPPKELEMKETAHPSLTAAGAGLANIPAGIEQNMVEADKVDKAIREGKIGAFEGNYDYIKKMLKGVTAPLTEGMEGNTAYDEYVKKHPELAGNFEAQSLFRGINLISGFTGGDPNEAWRNFESGQFQEGLTRLLAIPAVTLGAGKLAKGGLSEEEAVTPKGREAVNSQERLGALIGVRRPLQDAIGGEVRDSVWVAEQVQPLARQVLERAGYTDRAPLADRISAFFSGEPTKSMTGRRTGAFPPRRGAMIFQRIEQEPAFDIHGRPTMRFVSNVRAGARRALQVSSEMVNLAHEPFDEVVGQYSSNSVADIKAPIVQGLRDAAKEAGMTKNTAQADALNGLADHIDNHIHSVGELNDMKIMANKKIQDALDGLPGQQIGATADSVYAWKIAGDAIREHLYPKLEQLSGVDLRPFGMRERAAIIFRDGIYATYFSEIDPTQAREVALGYFANLEHGSLWERHILKRAGRLDLEPAGKFNLWFRKGVGKLGKGGKVESVETVPIAQRFLPPSEATGANQPFFRIQAGIPEEILYGKAVTRPEMRYAGQQEVEIPEEVPKPKPTPQTSTEAAGSSGTTAGAKFDADVFKQVQAEHPDWTLSQQLQEAGKRAIETTGRKSTPQLPPSVPETHAPMKGGSRYQQTLETGTTEKTIPEQTFGRSEAKKRQDAVGKSGQTIPERIFTGRKTRKESRWQYLTSSQEPTERVSVAGPGVIHTNDPKLAFNAMVGLRDYISGKTPKNMTPFAALPSDLQETYRNALTDLQRQLGQYAIYRMGGKAPRRVKITPEVPGKITKTRAAARYGTAIYAGGVGRTEAKRAEELADKLIREYGEQPAPTRP